MGLEFQKPADKEHKEKLDSKVVSAKWVKNRVVAGGFAEVEIHTAFVGNAAPIKITAKTTGGDEGGTLNDKIRANRYRGEILLKDTLPEGARLYFEVECPESGGAKGKSNAVPVMRPPKITNLRWSADTARRGDIVTLSADVKDVPIETPVSIYIMEHSEDGAHDPITELKGKVVDKKVEVLWEYEYHEDTNEIQVSSDLEPYGSEYLHPEYFFIVDIYGFMVGDEVESGLLRFKDHITVCLPPDAVGDGNKYTLVATLPDGEERKQEFDEDGEACIEEIPPGRCELKVEVEEGEDEDEEESAAPAESTSKAGVVAAAGEEEGVDPEKEKTLVGKYLLHTDLCIQSYQFYAQSLAWPLDPWYDRAARFGASRRDNLKEAIYKSFAERPADMNVPDGLRGPASSPRGNTADEKKAPVAKHPITGSYLLDPVISRYRNVRPGFPAFQFGAGQDWSVFRMSGPLVENVGKVFFCEYARPYNEEGKRQPRIFKVDAHQGQGPDVVYGFEGATGYSEGYLSANVKHGNWSMLGYVMSRKSHGGHDVHIVFRGSRSGSLARAGSNALISKGNPDWVSDLEHWLEPNPKVSAEGQICRGFGRAVVSSLESIAAVLDKVHKEEGAPNRIFVTGHSLGAALATAFASSAACGSFRDDYLQAGPKGWAWDTMELLPISAPSVGSKDFKAAFEAACPEIHRFYVAGDVITSTVKASHVGEEIKLKHLDDLNAHEPMSVRCSLEEWYGRAKGEDEWEYPQKLPAGAANRPVSSADFAAVEAALELAPFGQVKFLADLFHENTLQDTWYYIALLKQVISLSSSYKSWIRESMAKERRATLDDLFGNLNDYGACKKRVEGGDLAKLDEVQDDMADFLRLLYCSAVAKRHQAAYPHDLLRELLGLLKPKP